MYYEEMVMNGVLCWKNSPNGEWHKFSAEELTNRLIAVQDDLQNTSSNSDYAKCADEIMEKLYPEYNGIIRKGIVDILEKHFT